jgi:hypothetical protein
VVALILARQAYGELDAARGFLTGRQLVRIGVVLAWVGMLLAITAIVVMAVIGLLQLAATGSGPNFDPYTN